MLLDTREYCYKFIIVAVYQPQLYSTHLRLCVCLCVCLSVCLSSHVSVYMITNSKNNSSVQMKLGHIVVYENSSDEFDIDLIISSLLNDLTNCKRCFNVDIVNLYISAMNHAKKLKFCSYIHLPYINKMFQYRHA